MADRPYSRARGETLDGYVRAGERREGYVRAGDRPPGYRRASGIINARQTPETIKGFSGLAGYDALQDRRTLAFPKKGFEGQSAPEIGERLNMYGAKLRDGQIVSQRESIIGRGNRGEARRNGDMKTQGREIAPQRMPSPTANPRGPMPTAADTAARAQEMRAERSMQQDMQTGTTRTMGSSLFGPNDKAGRGMGAGPVSGISSKHGSGSVEWLSPQQQASRGPGTVKDDFGRVQPIRQEIARMGENQLSKGIGPQGQQMGQGGPMVAGGTAAPGMMPAGATKNSFASGANLDNLVNSASLDKKKKV